MEEDSQSTLKIMRDDELSEECRSLISSLPTDKDFEGIKLCNYQGHWYYYNSLQAVLNVRDHFRPLDTDLILASFPKSGTTWLKALVFAIVERQKHRSDPDQNHPLLTRNPHSLVPFLELVLYADNRVPDLAEYPSPRLFSTHMPFHTLSEAVIKASPCKVVYVCRNPKDVVVSAWHFRSRLLNSKAEMEAQFESFCSGVRFYGPFWDHVLGYWRKSLESPKQVFFVKYEEIKNDPGVQTKRLARFLGCPFTEEEERSRLVDEILELCSLRSLSNLDVNKNGKTPSSIECSAFFRKGEVGDWKNHLTPDMATRIDQIIEHQLRGSGLKFD